ncbi:taste receptor cell protein 1 [Choloepus didactylus]|uniref:taste receptor cell protein 1 n=1 Tax=Choloepus didactylus TaxID=27675 RepID=UPI00189D29FD|nr:taste receptor cell protein 1 [Choloepus didactylus]
MLGNLSLAENSLISDGSTLTDLALETINIRFTTMRPFLPQLLQPGSAPFVLLEEQTLQQVSPLVSGFYKEHPQGCPLLLFSNVDQWVGVYIEYKFQNPLSTNLRGLADHLAQNLMDPTLQKSSIRANGEKAELVPYEMLLHVLDQPFTQALKDKTSPEFQELQGQLMRGLTTILRPLQNFGQVVVEEFLLDPLMARVSAIFFRAAPAEAFVQDFMHQGLHSLWEAEGLSVEMIIPHLGLPSSGATGQPDTSTLCYAVAVTVLSLLLFAVSLVLVLKWKACCPGFSLGVLKPHS